jgi:hypothetical protein
VDAALALPPPSRLGCLSIANENFVVIEDDSAWYVRHSFRLWQLRNTHHWFIWGTVEAIDGSLKASLYTGRE